MSTDDTKVDLDRIIQELKGLLNGQPVTIMTYVSIIESGVLAMRRFDKMTGQQKKNLLLDALRAIAKEEGADPKVLEIIEHTAPPIIDSLVWFATSGVKMKNLKKCCC